MRKNFMLFFSLLLIVTGSAWGQTVIDNTATGGPIPSGWTGINNITSQPISQTAGGGYFLVESSASNRDYLVSNTYATIDGALSVTIDFQIATYGNGASSGAPLRVEMSLDGGTTWSSTLVSAANPTSTSYIPGNVNFAGPINSTQVRFRFSDANANAPFVRIQDIVISAEFDAAPVTLKSFTVASEGATANLAWSTAKEANNKGFEIERSADSKTWNAISFVASTGKDGNSSELLNYVYTDKQPLSGSNFYRLKQVDFDGAFEYSAVRKVTFGTDAKNYSIYPNPAQASFKVEGLSGTETIKIYNAFGNLVKSVNASSTSIEVAELAAGIYNVQILDANSVANHKLVIAK